MKFDTHLKFGDKRTRKSFTKHGSSEDVNATDEVADGAFIGTTGIIPVSHEVLGRNKQIRQPTQKGLEYQILLLK